MIIIRPIYIASALELEPGNLDALIMQAELQAKELDRFYDLLQLILKEVERQMREGGYSKDDMADRYYTERGVPLGFQTGYCDAQQFRVHCDAEPDKSERSS